jgi:hypothetical protein
VSLLVCGVKIILWGKDWGKKWGTKTQKNKHSMPMA